MTFGSPTLAICLSATPSLHNEQKNSSGIKCVGRSALWAPEEEGGIWGSQVGIWRSPEGGGTSSGYIYPATGTQQQPRNPALVGIPVFAQIPAYSEIDTHFLLIFLHVRYLLRYLILSRALRESCNPFLGTVIQEPLRFCNRYLWNPLLVPNSSSRYKPLAKPRDFAIRSCHQLVANLYPTCWQLVSNLSATCRQLVCLSQALY